VFQPILHRPFRLLPRVDQPLILLAVAGAESEPQKHPDHVGLLWVLGASMSTPQRATTRPRPCARRFVVREVVEIRREHGVAAPDRPVLRPGHLVADPVDQVLTDRVIVGIVFFLLCVRARRVRIVAIAERRFCL